MLFSPWLLKTPVLRLTICNALPASTWLQNPNALLREIRLLPRSLPKSVPWQEALIIDLGVSEN